jgi:hypothetical protein
MPSLPKLIFLGTGGDSVVVGKQIASAGGFILRLRITSFMSTLGQEHLPEHPLMA